ncbi:MAG: HNH endonuclease [Caulobacteraceae bacterium]|nr:HNH endonuclease [Caulobacteraceae bacterium]
MTTDTAAPRFTADTPCIDWPRSVNNYGYGVVQHNGKRTTAHRAAYENVMGPIPKGLVVDHICRNRKCVNVSHLRLLTDKENVLIGDGPTAKNKRLSHCKNGHLLSGENIAVYVKGSTTHRHCIACGHERDERKNAKRRAKTALIAAGVKVRLE